MPWEATDNFVISFSDITGEYRTQKNMDSFVEDLRKLAVKYGFEPDSWGDHDSMLRFMQQLGFLKK